MGNGTNTDERHDFSFCLSGRSPNDWHDGLTDLREEKHEKGNVIIFNPWMTEITQPNSTYILTKPLRSSPFQSFHPSNAIRTNSPQGVQPMTEDYIPLLRYTALYHQFHISVNGIKSSPSQIHSNPTWIIPNATKQAKKRRTSAIRVLRVPTPFEVWTGVD